VRAHLTGRETPRAAYQAELRGQPEPASAGPAPAGHRSAWRWLGRHWPVLALAGWPAAWFVVLAPGRGIAWHFFVAGSRLLFAGPYGPHYHRAGGLHLYANYPWLQIGPLSFSVAQVLRHLGPDNGLVAAEVAMSAMGLAALLVVRRIAVTVRPALAGDRAQRWTFLAGGAIFIIAWEELAVAYGHLDDVLALLCATLALWAAVRRRPVLTGLLLGLAADGKPWALVFLPVLLVACGLGVQSSAGRAGPAAGRVRALVLGGAAVAAVLAAGWLPFYLADPGTSAAMHYTIVNLPDSALRSLGVSAARTPSWDRSAQVILGCVLGALAIWRGRWPAVILLGVGARIALDPAAHGYYTAGVILGALIWDLLGSRRPVPLWTLVSYGALDLVPLVTHDNSARGAFRLYLVVVFTLAILLGPANWYAPSLRKPGRRSGRATATPLDTPAEVPGHG
jgi:hypothetical protein